MPMLVANAGRLLFPQRSPEDPRPLRSRVKPDTLFEIIDAKGEGFVRMSSLIVGLSALCRGDGDEASGYAFRAFDRDGDGGLCAAELERM